MKLGAMHHRVTLEGRPDAAANRLGEDPLEWVAACECWAAVEPLAGRELYREAQVQPDATHKVTIRFRPGVTTALRVNFEGRIFNVYRVDNPGEQDEQLWLFCTEAT